MREEKLIEFLRKAKNAPTQEEMKKAIGTRSNAILYQTLERLEEGGFIRREKGRWRNVELAGKANRDSFEDRFYGGAGAASSSEEWVPIPLLGIVAAGHPIEAVLVPEQMSVPVGMIRPGQNYFALEVRGDSMIDVNILNGDRIALRQANTANNGDIVVALVDGESATVKTFKKNGRKVQLVPANRDFKTIEIDADRVTIQGVLVGLVRKYDQGG
ncbi:MAG: transcriptional repressor LexA [Pyrinomonadaceae bacterium]